MSKDIEAGDVVQLKSFGPHMTVEFVGNIGTVTFADVAWFMTGVGATFKGRFFATSLKKVE